MKPWFAVVFMALLSANIAIGQPIQHVYRFLGKLSVVQPGCGPDLSPVKSEGNCTSGNNSGSYTEDVLPCGVRRQVYHTNVDWGLRYQNPNSLISENYTIQMYVKVTDWGKTWARIIDFSDGKLDQGIYFKNRNGSTDRCIDFYPSGIAGDCPYFNTSTYYLLTFTRNGQTGIMDVYVNNALFVSYNDSQKRYVSKAGAPIYIFRDDAEVSCESGAANFAYLLFSNQFSTQADVTKIYNEICSVANANLSADFSITPNPKCIASENVTIAYTGDVALGKGNVTTRNSGSGFFVYGTDYTMEWNWGGGTTISGSGTGPFQVNWTTGGVKSVTLKITSTVCQANEIVNVKRILIGDLDLSSTSEGATCANPKGKITLSALRGTAPFRYSVDSVNFQSDPVFLVSPATYKITIKDSSNCVVTKTLKIDGPENTFLSTIKDTTICTGQSIVLLTNSNATDFSWSPATALTDPAVKDPVANPIATTTYIVTGKRDSCVVRSDTVVVTVVPPHTLNLTPDSQVEAETPFQLTASSPELNGRQGVTYAWSPPDGLSDTKISNPYATISTTISYSVKVVSPEGCAVSGSVKLSVVRAPSFSLPDAFSPNGDNVNEKLFLIVRKGITLRYFRVYNRWGEVVFSSDQENQGWDGRFMGVQASSGSYVYKAEGITAKGKSVKKEGTVLLIR